MYESRFFPRVFAPARVSQGSLENQNQEDVYSWRESMELILRTWLTHVRTDKSRICGTGRQAGNSCRLSVAALSEGGLEAESLLL